MAQEPLSPGDLVLMLLQGLASGREAVTHLQQTVRVVESWGGGILSLPILRSSSPPALGGKVLASTASVDLV